MIEPLPNCFSICPTARSSAFRRSLRSSRSGGMVLLAAAGDRDVVNRSSCILKMCRSRCQAKTQSDMVARRYFTVAYAKADFRLPLAVPVNSATPGESIDAGSAQVPAPAEVAADTLVAVPEHVCQCCATMTSRDREVFALLEIGRYLHVPAHLLAPGTGNNCN